MIFLFFKVGYWTISPERGPNSLDFPLRDLGGEGERHPTRTLAASWWFFTNPVEKYDRQIGSFPQFSG